MAILTKQANGNGAALAALEAEDGQLRAELGKIDDALRDGDADVDTLERTLVRGQALRMRQQAVAAKLETERAEAAKRAEEEKRRQLAQLSGERDKALAVLADGFEGLVVEALKVADIEQRMDALFPMRGMPRQTGMHAASAIEEAAIRAGLFTHNGMPTGQALRRVNGG